MLNGSTLSLSSTCEIRSSKLVVAANRKTAGVRSKDGPTGLAVREGRRENDLTEGAFASASIYAVQMILSSGSESSLSLFAGRVLVPSSLLRFEAVLLDVPSEAHLPVKCMDFWMAPSTVGGNFIVDFAGDDDTEVDNSIGAEFSLPLSEL